MKKKIIIDTLEFKAMCKRAGYVIASKGLRENLMAYHFKVSDTNEFELSGTDGIRISYQLKQFDSLPGAHWVRSVLKERLDLAMSRINSKEIEISFDSLSGILGIKELGGQGGGALMDTLDSNFWKFDTTHIVARGRKILASSTISLKSFNNQVKAQLAKPPLTFKGMDDDDIFFVYVGAESGVTLSKGQELLIPDAKVSSVNRKFISDMVKNLDQASEISVKIALTREDRANMLIVEDKHGGHAMMPAEPKKMNFLDKVLVNDYFRIPGCAATFQKKQLYCVIVEGEYPESLERYHHSHPSGSPVYTLPESTQVFVETRDEKKIREQRQRRKK